MEDGTKKRSSQTYTKILTHNYSNTFIPIPVGWREYNGSLQFKQRDETFWLELRGCYV